MLLEDFIEMCKTRDWPALIDFLSSSVKNLGTKILVTAIIGEYHPDKKIAEEYGLHLWDNRLSSDPQTPLQSMASGDVDLLCFASAYFFAKQVNSINDEQLAKKIAAYVQANKMRLALLLESDLVPQEDKNIINDFFGNLILSKAEKEAYFKKEFSIKAKEKIVFIKAVDRVKQQLITVLDIAPHACQIYFSSPSQMKYATQGSGSITFTTKLPEEEYQRFVGILKNLEIDAYLQPVIHSNRNIDYLRRIAIFTSPLDIDKKLSALQEKEPSLTIHQPK